MNPKLPPLNLPIVYKTEPFYVLYWADPKAPNPHDGSLDKSQDSSFSPITTENTFSPFPAVVPSSPMMSNTPMMSAPAMSEPVFPQPFNSNSNFQGNIPTTPPVN